MATDPNKPNAPDPDKPKVGKSHWTGWHTLSLLAILIVFGAVCWTQLPHVSFLAGLGLLALFLVIAGHGVVGEWLGALIDERNRMSMSRLQTALWTVVVLSGFLAAAVWNVRPSTPEKVLPPNAPAELKAVVKLDIAVPPELWAVMGISVASLVGTPLIRSALTKKEDGGGHKQTVVLKELNRQANVNTEDAAWNGAYLNGRIACQSTPANARVVDLFQGEQETDAAHLDLGKVQVFFFTALLVFAYSAMMYQEFAAATGESKFCIPALPALSQGMVALLGISHAGYLANKAVDRGPAKPPAPQAT